MSAFGPYRTRVGRRVAAAFGGKTDIESQVARQLVMLWTAPPYDIELL
jgi:hypothetical protein